MAGAAAIASAIRRREVSSLEVVDAHIMRIEAYDPRIGAIPVLDAERARARAVGADRALACGGPLGPLHGVPFTAKEEAAIEGMPARAASLLFPAHVDRQDSAAVARLRAAGAIPLGKTNMSELAMFPDTINRVYGATHNPVDTSRSAGGSSGGEAAAVAGGLSPLGIGADYAGSIRCPAHFCGIFGLRPGIGATAAADGAHPADVQVRAIRTTLGRSRLSTWGALARNVEDLALAFSVLSGRSQDARMPHRVVLAPFAAGLRLEPVCATAVTRVLETLDGLGIAVIKGDPPGRADAEARFDALSAWEAHTLLGRWLPSRLDEVSPQLAAHWHTVAEAPPPVDVGREIERLEALAAAASAWLFDSGPLLAPVSSGPAFDLGTTDGVFERFADCRLASALGLPVVATPVLVGDDGLPAGVQLIGGRGGEPELLKLAGALAGAAA